MKYKGMMDIYKHEGADCSNYGISSKYDVVRIVETDANDKYTDAHMKNDVVIVIDQCCGKKRIRAIPVSHYLKNTWTMFGGCFIYTSNGCVPHSGTPIPLHDRVE